MDADAEAAADNAGLDPTAPEARSTEVDEQRRGMSLATLEFIASASRDPRLKSQLGQRLETLISRYAQSAERARRDEDGLDRTQVGALLAALDQGSALLMLSDSAVIDQRVLSAGMRRLLTPEGSDQV